MNNTTNTQKIEESHFLKLMEAGGLYLVDCFVEGLKNIYWKNALTLMILILTPLLSFASAYVKLMIIFENPLFTGILVTIMFFVTAVILHGLPFTIQRRKYQNDLDIIGLKTATGTTPRLIKVVKVDGYRIKLQISAKGIGLEKFKARLDDFRSSFQRTVESIDITENFKFIEIYLSTRKFTTKSPFSKLIGEVDKPYNILIGESRNGAEYTSLLDAPHFLIAGSTGNGKSMFFNNCLLSLARSTLQKENKAAIQFYLLDLKNGVEAKPYEKWPNVKIAKDEATSLKVLKALVKEMHERYELLERENKGHKKIIPEIHKKDVIVLCIDEASVLFGKTSNKTKQSLVNECRDAFDELCKLARAAAIHIITATQRPVKESLDTRALENLNGRVCFKMSSSKGSELALGNGSASKLPDVKGRCVWRDGNNFVEIQAPFLSDEKILSECKELAQEFAKKENGNFQKMLNLNQRLTKNVNNFEQGLAQDENKDAKIKKED